MTTDAKTPDLAAVVSLTEVVARVRLHASLPPVQSSHRTDAVTVSRTDLEALCAAAEQVADLEAALQSSRQQIEAITQDRRAIIDQGEADSARLDWLERELFDRKWDGCLQHESTWHMAGPYRHALAKMRGETLRAAIDAVCAGGKHETE